VTDTATPSIISNYLGDGLVYVDDVPVRWSMLDATPSDTRLAILNDENERLLRYVSSLDEYLHESKDGDPLAHDVARLEFKVNILMEMVSQVLAQKLDLPAASRLEMNANGLVCHMPEAPVCGRQFQLSVYLNRQYLKPLEVCASVVGIESSGEGTVKVALQFQGLSEIVQDHLERLIFRQHRRMVALLHQSEK